MKLSSLSWDDPLSTPTKYFQITHNSSIHWDLPFSTIDIMNFSTRTVSIKLFSLSWDDPLSTPTKYSQITHNSPIHWDRFELHREAMRWNCLHFHEMTLYPPLQSVLKPVTTLLSTEIHLSLELNARILHPPPFRPTSFHFDEAREWWWQESVVGSLVTLVLSEMGMRLIE